MGIAALAQPDLHATIPAAHVFRVSLHFELQVGLKGMRRGENGNADVPRGVTRPDHLQERLTDQLAFQVPQSDVDGRESKVGNSPAV